MKNFISPNAVIEDSVVIGKNVHIDHFTIIRGNVVIGDDTYIGSNVSIGSVAEHSTDKYELLDNYSVANKKIIIGSSVVIREHVTIHQPMSDLTYIGNNVYIMNKCHIAHDNCIDDSAIVSAGSTLAGWVRVMKYANVGVGSVIHQFTTIGPYAMVAAGSTVVKDIPPFCKFIPGKEPRSNANFAIKKYGLPEFASAEFRAVDNKLNVEWESVRHKDRKIFKRGI